MKKRVVMMFLALALAATFMTGCGTQTKAPQENSTETKDESVNADNGNTESGNANNDNVDNDNTDTTDAATESTEDTTSQLQLGYALEIPKGFEKILPEAKPNQMVEKIIAQYYNVPQNQSEKLAYYYNYVDLNGDSVDEILALVAEVDKDWDEADEIDEESLLWISIEDENVIADAVNQVFTEAEAPVYISYHMTEGYRDLIIREDEDEYYLLVWNGERYQTENEGQRLPNLNGYEGQAVLTMEGNYHVLGSAQQ